MVTQQRPRGRPYVPVPRTPLVGRQREMATARSLLLDSRVPLLTLTGPGGVGKTRLALQIATESRERFADGAWFVSLAPLRDPRLIATAIAETLGLTGASELRPSDRVIASLGEREALLILDSVEHLLPSIPVIADLLTSCHSLQILATSRAPLRISGEHELPVPQLALPPLHALPSAGELSQIESVALFVLRAAAANPEFTLTEANAAAVADICVQLDGLPLAIELAASRTRLLTPDALRARLSNRLLLLTDGPRDQPLRLRSMRDAIAWSCDLLGAAERAMFRRLAVFAGGFSLEAAAAVAAPPYPAHAPSPITGAGDTRLQTIQPVPTTPPVLDLLSSLVEASLVAPLKGEDGDSRFSMLETIREFGLEQLAVHGETAESSQRHAVWCLALAEQIEPDLYGGRRQGRCLDLLEREHDNLRAALAWLVDSGEEAVALRLAVALLRFWYTRGHLNEGRDWLERVLALADGAPAALRAKALIGLAVLAWPQDDRTRATAALQQALPLVEGSADREGLAFALLAQAFMALDLGDFALAAKASAEGKMLYESLGRRWDAGMITLCLAKSAFVQGDLPRAEALCEENLAVFSDIEDEYGLAATRLSLGWIRMAQGDPLRAVPLEASAVCGYQALGERLYTAASLESLAAALGGLNQAGWSARFLGAAQTLRNTVGAPTFFADSAVRDQATTAALAALGEPMFEAAWSAGARASLDEIIAEASSFISTPSTANAAEPVVAAPPFSLTPREREVLRLLVEGHSNAEIGSALSISDKTVRNHVTSILTKLGVSSRTAAATFALRRGLA